MAWKGRMGQKGAGGTTGQDAYGAVAQLGGRGLCKPEVVGSIPISSTKNRKLRRKDFKRPLVASKKIKCPSRAACSKQAGASTALRASSMIFDN